MSHLCVVDVQILTLVACVRRKNLSFEGPSWGLSSTGVQRGGCLRALASAIEADKEVPRFSPSWSMLGPLSDRFYRNTDLLISKLSDSSRASQERRDFSVTSRGAVSCLVLGRPCPAELNPFSRCLLPRRGHCPQGIRVCRDGGHRKAHRRLGG